MSTNSQYFEVNKATWNTKVKVHAKSEMYAMEAFKNGKTSLMQYELDALGDVNGKTLLHLQCHFGQDTLSWSKMYWSRFKRRRYRISNTIKHRVAIRC